ncbi:Vps41, partial [Symbiodinium sp. KB8]
MFHIFNATGALLSAAFVLFRSDEDDRCRAEALARLSENTDPDLAVELLLKLGSSEVFKMVRRLISAGHDPAKWLLPKLQQFFEVDDKQACELAVSCRTSLPVDHVMSTLEKCETRWKHEQLGQKIMYLKQLFAQDEIAGQGYHLQMVELFAEYDPSGLQPFLRASERYPLDQALEVCQRKGLRQEVAYLLGRAGRVADALRILLEEVGDVRQAVEFAAETQ